MELCPFSAEINLDHAVYTLKSSIVLKENHNESCKQVSSSDALKILFLFTVKGKKQNKMKQKTKPEQQQKKPNKKQI